ncbi:MAG: aspartate/glutamate racemase family protein [Vampirovibrionales bacterium]|nr:aspartate/glutamate racemase family protein [Vampirovibrionales bacterium]
MTSINTAAIANTPHWSLTIGVFDSGVGGLTVLAPLMAQFPDARFVYVADNAYMPYGEQSPAVLLERLTQLLPWLAKQCDVIALACNTAASLMIEHGLMAGWSALNQVPIIDPIQPVCEQLANDGNLAHPTIVILATPKTTAMGVYPRVLQELNPALDVRSVSGQQLAGYFEHGHPDPAAYETLLDTVAAEIQTHLSPNTSASLVLGCTHYPHMRAALAARLPNTVTMLDPAEAMVTKLTQVVEGLASASMVENQDAVKKPSVAGFWVTGDPERFKTVAQQCSGLVIPGVQSWQPKDLCVEAV